MTQTSAAPRGEGADPGSHALPLFEGRRSRRHTRHPLWRLRLRAEWEALRRRAALSSVGTMAQFVGFPRSGHSLIGSLIDAHPGATIAHELDALGLFAKGLPMRTLPALMAWNSAAFSRHGRWWNGFSYAVDGAEATGGVGGGIAVIGDKKGDWAARWCAADPALLDRFAEATALRCRWILVTRHPFDNVATMALRRGGHYDRLRIDGTGRDGFRAALKAEQASGRIAASVPAEMVADYAGLAAAVAGMKARVAARDWLEIEYERFAADPRSGLDRIADFLGLGPAPRWRDAAAALVRPGGSRSRDAIGWAEAERAALDAVIARHDYLGSYRNG